MKRNKTKEEKKENRKENTRVYFVNILNKRNEETHIMILRYAILVGR